MGTQRWRTPAQACQSSQPESHPEGRISDFGPTVLQRFATHQSVYSVVSGLAAGIFFLTLVVDVLFTKGPLAPVMVNGTFFAMSAVSAIIPLVVGKRYPRWAGFIPVGFIAIATVYFVGVSARPQPVVSSLQELPIIALYLGWFYKARLARVVMSFLLLLLIAAMVAGANFGSEGPFTYPLGFGALVVMIFCFESGSFLQRVLERNANKDYLTGALNRRGISERFEIEHERSRRHGTALIVVVIDFDYFKRLNDELGHAGGDDILRSSTLTWKQNLSSTDVLGRLGGDEFIMLLPQRNLADVSALLTRLRDESTHSWSWGSTVIQIEDSLEDAVERADAELYLQKAKRSA